MAGAGAEHRQVLCSADAIYYWETNISQGVNTNNSYYLRLCLLKVMSLNGQDGAIKLGVWSYSHYLWELRGLINWIHFFYSPHMYRMLTTDSEAMSCFIYWYNLLYKATLKSWSNKKNKHIQVLQVSVSINTCSCGLGGDRDLPTAHLLVIEGPACSFTARQVRLIWGHR